MLRAWDINEKQFNQSVNIALINVAREISEYNNHRLPNKNPVFRYSSNYYIVNIESQIDANVLEYYLTKEFNNNNLHIDFEYAIYDCESEEMVYGNYINFSSSIRAKSDLPKYDEFVYYFGIKFPSRKNYIVGKMTIGIIFSGVLLIVLAFFAYSMSIILQQKKLSELQRDFINNMTHEFKTPITTINISADVLLDGEIIKSPKRLNKYAEIIKQQNDRLNSHVGKVLQIAKIEKQVLELNKEYVNLSEIIEELIKSIKFRFNDVEGEIINDINQKPVMIFADKMHLTNILFNLMANAVKYCNTKYYIHICSKMIKNSLIIEIQDKGPGIPKEFHGRIFKKFFRVPTGNVHNVKGFGLGLYYVKNICDAHKWKIKFESAKNKGCKFAIKIRSNSYKLQK
jgi:two-component system phosphate regulon sensor histidine kinase PhoR